MSELRCRWKVGVSLLALLAAAALADESAFAARLLTATVEVDGQLVLQTAYSDSGTEKPATVWRYLAGEPGWAETAKIQADEAEPQRARLKGNIVIRIQHVDRQIVQANASELELVRIGLPGDRWFLPETEVERLAAASGISPPPVLPSWTGPLWPWLAVGAAMVIGLIVLLGFSFALRRPSRECK